MKLHPPERFHAFVSYTTREEEVLLVKPIIDHFLNNILRPAIKEHFGELPVFYDGYFVQKANRPQLESVLRYAVEESELLLAFVSPHYLRSRWCRFEWAVMASKRHRAWFDIARKPPGLRDRRSRWRRPNLTYKAAAQVRRWFGPRRAPTRPGGPIVSIVWKRPKPAPSYLEMIGDREFDWTQCTDQFWLMIASRGHREDIEREVSDALREPENNKLSDAVARVLQSAPGEIDLSPLLSTAHAIIDILRDRRMAYDRRFADPASPEWE